MKKVVDKIEYLEFSTREYFFVGLILFFAGLLLGIVFSPKGERTIGSNNGNNNTGSITDTSENACNE